MPRDALNKEHEEGGKSICYHDNITIFSNHVTLVLSNFLFSVVDLDLKCCYKFSPRVSLSVNFTKNSSQQALLLSCNVEWNKCNWS